MGIGRGGTKRGEGVQEVGKSEAARQRGWGTSDFDAPHCVLLCWLQRGLPALVTPGLVPEPEVAAGNSKVHWGRGRLERWAPQPLSPGPAGDGADCLPPPRAPPTHPCFRKTSRPAR